MTTNPDMPKLSTEIQSFILCKFTTLCKMFRSFSDASFSGELTQESLTLYNDQLSCIPTFTENHNDLQKADLSVIQQWLRRFNRNS